MGKVVLMWEQQSNERHAAKKSAPDASFSRTEKSQQPFWWQSHQDACVAAPPGRGELCPQCGRAPLDYNDQFILACPLCGYVAEAGAFT